MPLILICHNCKNTVVCDDISDNGYLYSQYGWEYEKSLGIWECPICIYGIIVGNELIQQVEELRRKRLENDNN
jgi:hypothetical protein